MTIGDPQVEHSAAFEVGEDRTHRRRGLAVLAEGRAGVVALLRHVSVALLGAHERADDRCRRPAHVRRARRR